MNTALLQHFKKQYSKKVATILSHECITQAYHIVEIDKIPMDIPLNRESQATQLVLSDSVGARAPDGLFAIRECLKNERLLLSGIPLAQEHLCQRLKSWKSCLPCA